MKNIYRDDVFESSDDWGICKICKQWEDLRFGVCFDCATKAEKKAVLDGRIPLNESTLRKDEFDS